jgi:DNA-binding transcriptional ArsR family regulator
MAENKSELFNDRRQRLSSYAEAMSHPAKVAILELLAQEGALSCGEITEQLPLAQPTVSQHLKKLKESGLILYSKDGLKSIYSLNGDSIDQLRNLVYELLNKITNPL